MTDSAARAWVSRWIDPPPSGARYRWRDLRHGQVFEAEWLGIWHNPARRTHHGLWRLPGGDDRFAEQLAEWAEMVGPAG